MKHIPCGAKFPWTRSGDPGVDEELNQISLGVCKNIRTKKRIYLCSNLLLEINVFFFLSLNTSHPMPTCHHINQLDTPHSRQRKLYLLHSDFLELWKSWKAANSNLYFAKTEFKPLFQHFLELKQNSTFKCIFGKLALFHSIYSSPFQLCSALICVCHFRADKCPQWYNKAQTYIELYQFVKSLRLRWFGPFKEPFS